VTDDGYYISTRDGPMPTESGQPPTMSKPTIPILNKPTSCARYRGIVPPPRSKNKDAPICDPNKPGETKQFWVYDHAALRALAVRLKDDNPEEIRVIIEGTATVDYEPIADALDLTRDTLDSTGAIRNLFPEAVIGGG